MGKIFRSPLFAVALMILGLSIGFFVGRVLLPVNMAPEEKEDSTPANDLYSTQTASIRGIVTNVDGNNLTVVNSATQAEGTVKASDKIIINKFGGKPAAPSTNLASIDLNKEASLSLEMINGEYQVTTIFYNTPMPSLSPATLPYTDASASAKPSTKATPKP